MRRLSASSECGLPSECVCVSPKTVRRVFVCLCGGTLAFAFHAHTFQCLYSYLFKNKTEEQAEAAQANSLFGIFSSRLDLLCMCVCCVRQCVCVCAEAAHWTLRGTLNSDRDCPIDSSPIQFIPPAQKGQCANQRSSANHLCAPPIRSHYSIALLQRSRRH